MLMVRHVDYDPKVDGYVRLYEWQKVEPKLAHVQNLDGEDIYYGTSKDEEAINFAAALTSPGRASFYGQLYSHKEFQDEAFADTWGLKGNNVSNSVYMGHYGPKAKVTLLRVAQDQVKHYKNYKHVNSFFMRVEGKTITMSNALIRWHTARIVGEGLDKLRFLQNYAIFDQDKASKYQKLEQYYNDNYVELRSLLNRGRLLRHGL
jgi:hypothetical protein